MNESLDVLISGEIYVSQVISSFDLWDMASEGDCVHYTFRMNDVIHKLVPIIDLDFVHTVCLGLSADGDEWCNFVKAKNERIDLLPENVKRLVLPGWQMLWHHAIDGISAKADGVVDYDNATMLPWVRLQPCDVDQERGGKRGSVIRMTVYLPGIKVSGLLRYEHPYYRGSLDAVMSDLYTSAIRYEGSYWIYLPDLMTRMTAEGSYRQMLREVLGVYSVTNVANSTSAKLLGQIVGLLHYGFYRCCSICDFSAEYLVDELVCHPQDNILIPITEMYGSDDYLLSQENMGNELKSVFDPLSNLTTLISRDLNNYYSCESYI